MPNGASSSITTTNNVEANSSPFFPGVSAGFCAPPAQIPSENENPFVVIPENTELCTPDPRSPYAQKLFAENPPPAASAPAPTGEAKAETISGEATGNSQSTGEAIVEGFYVFFGTFSFLYRLFT